LEKKFTTVLLIARGLKCYAVPVCTKAGEKFVSDEHPEADEEDREGNLASFPDQDTPGFRWTVKRRRFCWYFVEGNGVVGKAAMDAGYLNESEGSYLLGLPAIRKKISNDLRYKLNSEDVTHDSVISRLQDWANASAADFFEYTNDGGVERQDDPEDLLAAILVPRRRLVLKDLDNLTPAQRSRVKKLNVKDTQFGQDVTLEVVDAQKANDRLLQILGLLNSDNQMSNQPTPEDTARMIHEYLTEADESDGFASTGTEPAPGSEAAGEVAPAQEG